MTEPAKKREVVKEMKRIWNVKKYDFMGFILLDNDIITYHHLRVPAKDNGPVSIYNGALLCGKTSHPYLHIIANYNREMFEDLTKILIEVNDQLYLPTSSQLIRYNEILNSFEREHSGETNKKGYPLIKEIYTRRLQK